jgi:hypothetical protein
MHAEPGLRPARSGARARGVEREPAGPPATVQRLALNASPAPAKDAVAASAAARRAPNRTGLPDRLKGGIEALSGISLDDVRVHRNSGRSVQLNALAHTQGSDIHLGPGQEQHLAHEAWHVVQQKQGRVKPTLSLGGTAINDDAGLEREADRMGARAAGHHATPGRPLADAPAGGAVAQCVGNIRFANLSTDQMYVTKGQSIIDGLRATPSIMNFLRDKDALITLEADPQLASVRVVGDQVQITLSPWFFEQQSRGRILGMLAHEFGVHPLATEGMTAQERQDEVNNVNVQYPSGRPGQTVTAAAAGQRDHIYAAVEGQPRFREYRRTLYEMARGLLATAQGAHPGGATEAHVTDLIMTYLSDIAMILATNDHRGQIVTHSDETATVFNRVRQRWIAWLHVNGTPTDNELIRLTPARRSGGDVIGEVGGIIGRRVLAGIRFWQSPTSNNNMAHAPVGAGVAPTNRIQTNVLADQGLQLQGFPGTRDTLFQAMVRAGFPGAQHRIQQVIAGQHHPGEAVQRAGVIAANNNYRASIDYQMLDIFAQALQRRIRILEPSGRMLQAGNDQHALLTLVWVREPAPHYRAARPIPVAVAAPVAAPVLALPVLPPPVVNRPRTRSLGGGQPAPNPGGRQRKGSF